MSALNNFISKAIIRPLDDRWAYCTFDLDDLLQKPPKFYKNASSAKKNCTQTSRDMQIWHILIPATITKHSWLNQRGFVARPNTKKKWRSALGRFVPLTFLRTSRQRWVDLASKKSRKTKAGILPLSNKTIQSVVLGKPIMAAPRVYLQGARPQKNNLADEKVGR